MYDIIGTISSSRQAGYPLDNFTAGCRTVCFRGNGWWLKSDGVVWGLHRDDWFWSTSCPSVLCKNTGSAYFCVLTTFDRKCTGCMVSVGDWFHHDLITPYEWKYCTRGTTGSRKNVVVLKVRHLGSVLTSSRLCYLLKPSSLDRS